MKLAVLGSLAAVAATVVANEQYEHEDDFNNEDYIPEDEDPYSSRALATSPVPFPVLAMLTMLNFVNALQESWAEEDDELGRDGDMNGDGSKLGKWSSNVWRAVKGVPGVIYETSTMVAPLTLRYMTSDGNEHPDCQKVMLCELNVRMKERFGKPGEIAMQLASSMAGYALSANKDAKHYDDLVNAARSGRRGKQCQELYPECVARSDSSAVPALFNLATRILQSNKNKDKSNN